jgi:hypothetical protein
MKKNLNHLTLNLFPILKLMKHNKIYLKLISPDAEDLLFFYHLLLPTNSKIKISLKTLLKSDNLKFKAEPIIIKMSLIRIYLEYKK